MTKTHTNDWLPIISFGAFGLYFSAHGREECFMVWSFCFRGDPPVVEPFLFTFVFKELPKQKTKQKIKNFTRELRISNKKIRFK